MTKEEMLEDLKQHYGFRVGAVVRDPAGVHAKVTIIGSEQVLFETVNLPGSQCSGNVSITDIYQDFKAGLNSVIGYIDDVRVPAKPAKEEMSFQDKYPHVCQYCGARCWNGGITYDCSNPVCPTKNK